MRIFAAALLQLSLAVLALGALALFSATAAAQPVVSGAGGDHYIQNMHVHPWFWTVFFASIVGWILGIVKGFSSSVDWLKRFWSQPHPLAVLSADFVVFGIFGAYIGTGIYNPTNFVAALAAGLTWPLGLAALTTRDTTDSGSGAAPEPTPDDPADVATGGAR